MTTTPETCDMNLTNIPADEVNVETALENAITELMQLSLEGKLKTVSRNDITNLQALHSAMQKLLY